MAQNDDDRGLHRWECTRKWKNHHGIFSCSPKSYRNPRRALLEANAKRNDRHAERLQLRLWISRDLHFTMV